jgi:hypothetical protein
MGVSINTRQAYSEIDEFLSLLTEEQINKIPLKLREFFKEEKDKEYKKQIDSEIPIKDQNLKSETLAIIAMLNLQYWCEDEQEKERLKKVYAQNEKTYQEDLQIKFNPDNIFKNRQNISSDFNNTDTKTTAMIEFKEKNFLQKILDKIKKLFNRKKLSKNKIRVKN